MSLFLQNYVLLAQTPDFLPFPALIPEFAFMEPVAHIVGSAEVVILAASALLMIGLTALIRYTRVGKAMRATQQDMAMARLVGIDVDRVISLTFVIGSVLAAIGGVLVGSYLGQINFAIGFMAGIKAFTAAVLGGIGNIPGAVLGGFVLHLPVYWVYVMVLAEEAVKAIVIQFRFHSRKWIHDLVNTEA
jgi:branched-chain amino acid transport system permease protein